MTKYLHFVQTTDHKQCTVLQYFMLNNKHAEKIHINKNKKYLLMRRSDFHF